MGSDQINELLARTKIEQTILNYFRALDRNDLPLLRACCTDNADLDYGESYQGGVDGFLASMVGPDGVGDCHRTMHFAGNVTMQVDGDRAAAETYAIANRTVVDPNQLAGTFFVMWMRYLDRFTRQGTEWLITSRTAVIEWMRVDPADTWVPVASTSRRDASDPSYRILAGPTITASLRPRMRSKGA